MTIANLLRSRALDLLLFLVLSFAPGLVLAQFSGAYEGMSFQGYLTDDSDNPINAATDITIRLFDAPTGGTQIWERAYTSVPVGNGVFHLTLVNGTPDLGTVAFDSPRWLQIEVESEVVGPRTELTSAPFALSLRNMRIIPNDGSNDASVLGGNLANGKLSFVEGATISGGGRTDPAAYNFVHGSFGTVGGGFGNIAETQGTVAGGGNNHAEASSSAVGGGYGNVTEENYSTIAGGLNNNAEGQYSSIAGGQGNHTGGDWAAVGGGDSNDAQGDYSTIIGGDTNTAHGDGATAAGGRRNQAGASYSFVAGDRARTRTPGEAGTANGDQGTFVWSDRSVTGSDFTSTGPNQFLIQAAGGIGIDTNDPAGQLHIAKANSGADGFIIESNELDRGYLYFATNTSLTFDTFRGSDSRRLPIAMQPNGGRVGIGTTTPSEKLEVNGNVLANNVGVPSDARYKKNVRPIAGPLGLLSMLNGVRYEFDREAHPEKAFDEGDQLGLIAQDVREALPELVHESDSGYLSVNYIGVIPVLIEAIKEQNRAMQEKDTRIDALEARLSALEEAVGAAN